MIVSPVHVTISGGVLNKIEIYPDCDWRDETKQNQICGYGELVGTGVEVRFTGEQIRELATLMKPFVYLSPVDILTLEVEGKWTDLGFLGGIDVENLRVLPNRQEVPNSEENSERQKANQNLD